MPERGGSSGRTAVSKAALYIHGKGGDHREAGQYAKNCPGFDVLGVEYQPNLPWMACDQIRAAYDRVRGGYGHLCVIANSIGAYFAMLSLGAAPSRRPCSYLPCSIWSSSFSA